MDDDLASGLVYTRDLVVAGEDPRQLTRGEGRPARVRRGVYVDAAAWSAARPAERHRALVISTAASMRSRAVAAGKSAAIMLGLPVLGRLPTTVHVLVPAAGGGRSTGLIRRIPVEELPDVVVLDGVAVTTPARTVVDLARTEPFAAGLTVADQALNRQLTTREELMREIEASRGHRGVRRARLVVERADPRAESPGESLSRAQMHLLGLPIPDLQRAFHDTDGFVGRVDFWWEDLGIIGEFDGRVKYESPAVRDGLNREALWAEKRREDRLRRLSGGFVRWVWSEALDLQGFGRLLAAAGIQPRRR